MKKSEPELDRKNVLVVGLGISGMALVRFLCKKGSNVTVTDLASEDKLGSFVLKCRQMGVHLELGGHRPKSFQKADMIVISPGVPLAIPQLIRAIEDGVPVFGEMELAYRYIHEPIIAVTGTNGKTTTTAVVGEMMKHSGKKVFVGGNIGDPLIGFVEREEKVDVVVAEVSSFQLDTALTFSPKVGILLNVTPDHLDRYPNLDAYARTKGRLFEKQKEGDAAILNGSDPAVRKVTTGIQSRKLFFGYLGATEEGAIISEDRIRVSFLEMGQGKACDIRIGEKRMVTEHFDLTGTQFKGRYSRENAAAASLASLAAGGNARGIQSALNSFKGLPHRLEPVENIGGIRFVNDSKATNVFSVICALDSFSEPVILIMGGRDKGSDFRILTDWVRKHVKIIILIGEAAPLIRKALAGAASMRDAAGMEEAVISAYREARPGDVVLLSPACASFDMFTNYTHRGDEFRKAVMGLK